MNKSFDKNQWDHIKEKIKQRWEKLTEDDLGKIEGNFDELANSLEQSYGYPKSQAASEFESFKHSLNDGNLQGIAGSSRTGADEGENWKPNVVDSRQNDQEGWKANTAKDDIAAHRHTSGEPFHAEATGAEATGNQARPGMERKPDLSEPGISETTQKQTKAG